MMLIVLLGSWVSIRRLFLGSQARLGKPVPEPIVHPVRAHGNAAEWVPFGILALLLLELGGAPSFALHLMGGGYVLLRLGHAGYALNRGPFGVAVVVAVLHYTLLFCMGAWAVWLHFSPL
ncbi:MAG: MAPEG family protein [Archangiaceae bacterium]|nr:MAPEG family protein [Archangiaceae bacterium]